MMWGQKTTANDLADSLGDMLALFDDEGNFREEYQDQASVAMERAEANLKNFINGREVSIIGPSSQNVSYDAMKELMWLHDEVAKVLAII